MKDFMIEQNIVANNKGTNLRLSVLLLDGTCRCIPYIGNGIFILNMKFPPYRMLLPWNLGGANGYGDITKVVFAIDISLW